MSDPGPLPVQQALDRIDALERTIIGMLARLDAIESRRTVDAISRLDLVLDQKIGGGSCSWG